MPGRYRPVRVLTIALVTTCICSANQDGTAEQPPAKLSVSEPTAATALDSWMDLLWSLPIVRLLAPLFPEPAQPEPEPAPAMEPPNAADSCGVAPLEPIEDAAAQQLEAIAGTDTVVDVSGMAPGAAEALARFESRVAAAGGTVILKSAYRPAAYQQHLQSVWYKWMNELRDNRHSGCAELRTQVEEEFTRHRLLESQPPVSVSDHTRGLAFDAAVDLPRRARVGRRRVSLDTLARFSGFVRPAVAADPVHFKYVGSSSIVRRRHRA